MSLDVGAERTISVTVLPSEASQGYEFKNYQPEVASFDMYSGKVTGLQEGSTTMTFSTSNGLKATLVVTVKATA